MKPGGLALLTLASVAAPPMRLHREPWPSIFVPPPKVDRRPRKRRKTEAQKRRKAERQARKRSRK